MQAIIAPQETIPVTEVMATASMNNIESRQVIDQHKMIVRKKISSVRQAILPPSQ